MKKKLKIKLNIMKIIFILKHNNFKDSISNIEKNVELVYLNFYEKLMFFIQHLI